LENLPQGAKKKYSFTRALCFTVREKFILTPVLEKWKTAEYVKDTKNA
jgi:hypothetical protein